MNSYKINVQALTEQQKKDVQDAFFRLGYRWYGGSDKYTWLSAMSYFAYLNSSLTASLNDDDYVNSFHEHPNKEITYKDLMTLAYGDNTMNTQKEFTKASLKDGMVVVYRNGYKRLVYREMLLTLEGGNGSLLSCFNEDLSHSYHRTMDIMEVIYMGESLWKRFAQTQQQKQLAELKTAQEELLLKAKEIGDKIVALQQG